MASQTPMILADNIFDAINLYPLAARAYNGTPIAFREVNYLADYRRERTYFQGAAAITPWYVSVDLGAGITAAPDTLWIDRGHNLWGRTIGLEGGNDPLTAWFDPTLFSRAVPAIGSVGGDPTTGWCATEEGAIYTMVTNAVARRNWRVIDNTGTALAPIIPGIILGKRLQMLNYSSVLDEDEGERDERQENSLIKGYYGRERVYSARKLRVQLATIGITEYDTIIRTMRRLLFERDQPFVTVMNYGIRPERAWLYQYQGTGFSAPAERVYRRHSFVAQELGPLIR